MQKHYPGDGRMCSVLSVFEETSPKRIRMANLCVAFCHRVNGVAELHTAILTTSVFRDFHRLFPEQFVTITNGITPRR